VPSLPKGLHGTRFADGNGCTSQLDSAHETSGAVTLVARRGRAVEYHAYGVLDLFDVWITAETDATVTSPTGPEVLRATVQQ
jgi:hypothetical protein